jgi:hypothetical protein
MVQAVILHIRTARTGFDVHVRYRIQLPSIGEGLDWNRTVVHDESSFVPPVCPFELIAQDSEMPLLYPFSDLHLQNGGIVSCVLCLQLSSRRLQEGD